MFFKYHARDVNGKPNDGEINAFDKNEALKKLQEQSFFVISLEMIDVGEPEIARQGTLSKQEGQHKDFYSSAKNRTAIYKDMLKELELLISQYYYDIEKKTTISPKETLELCKLYTETIRGIKKQISNQFEQYSKKSLNFSENEFKDYWGVDLFEIKSIINMNGENEDFEKILDVVKSVMERQYENALSFSVDKEIAKNSLEDIISVKKCFEGYFSSLKTIINMIKSSMRIKIQTCKGEISESEPQKEQLKAKFAKELDFTIATKKDCINQCPYCGADTHYVFMQRCFKCKRLKDFFLEGIENKIRKNINGGIHLYDFSPDKRKILILTEAKKEGNLYLYEVETNKIIWGKKVLNSIDNTFIQRLVCFEDQIVLVFPAPSVERGDSFLKSYKIISGDFISQLEMKGQFTNAMKIKQSIIVGCRDGFLYNIDKNLNIINKFCFKESNVEYGAWGIPAPFNLVANDTDDYIACSFRALLFLFDSEINFIWSKNISNRQTEFRYQRHFLGNDRYQNEKYLWACRVLEVVRSDTVEQIKIAFRKKVLQWHPDRHKEDNKDFAENKFKEVVNAYEFLTKVSENELSKELSNMGMPFEVTTSMYDTSKIVRIDFVRKKVTNNMYIKAVINSKEVVVDLGGKIFPN
jgi:hypothetical protein